MRPLIAGNWKMNGRTDWTDRPVAFDSLLPSRERTSVEILICPPFTLISNLVEAAKGTDIQIGAQNCHANEAGAHTGEISAEMLADLGAAYIIVGHSERRAAGESSDDVSLKAQAAFRAGLTPIICVGETLEEREAGSAKEIVSAQISGSIPENPNKFVIAYEPVWAIGTGRVAEVGDIAQMHEHIREQVGPAVRLLYGGSVKPGNAGDILATPNVNGALIGGASLKAEDLAAIARQAL